MIARAVAPGDGADAPGARGHGRAAAFSAHEGNPMQHQRLILCATLALAAASGAAQAQAYRDFTIGAGFTPDPQVGTGTTGGSRDASSFGGNCTGRIASSPDHTINVTSTVDLKLYTESTTDSTLVLVGPSGTFCDDDSRGGLDAEINAVLTPGTYEVYVGNFGTTAGEYSLTLTENLGGGSGSAEITNERDFELGAGFLPDPQTSTGYTGGGRSAAQAYGNGCAGDIANTPDHTLTVTSGVDLSISVRADSGVDATLVVVGNGRKGNLLCNDDSNGLDPAVSGYLAPGVYEIYVGDIGNGGNYVISLTENL